MEIINAINDRRAFRELAKKAIPTEVAQRILLAGTLAPSCYNNQPWHLIAVSGENLAHIKDTLPEANAWVRNAPLIIAVATRESDDCRLEDGRDYALFDAGLCTMNIMTQATAEGVVAHPIAGFNPKKVKATLGIPKDYVLIVLIIVGYKSDAANPETSLLTPWQKAAENSVRDRKDPAGLISSDRWTFPREKPE